MLVEFHKICSDGLLVLKKDVFFNFGKWAHVYDQLLQADSFLTELWELTYQIPIVCDPKLKITLFLIFRKAPATDWGRGASPKIQLKTSQTSEDSKQQCKWLSI